MPFSVSFVNPEKYTSKQFEEFALKDEQPPSHWNKALTQDEFDNVRGLCKSRGNIYVIPAAFIPVRTNNAKNFCKDFFLPTFFNQALKVKSVVAKCFAILFSLIFDIATLPIRLLTAGPWALINRKVAKKESHPLHKYLAKNGVGKEHLNAEHLRIKLTWDEEVEDKSNSNRDGDAAPQMKTVERWKEFNVNFIRSPIHEDFDYFDEGSRDR